MSGRERAVELTRIVASEQETQALATQLAPLLPAGTVVALEGTLGAGKTRFVQGLAAGLGIDVQQVMSPTYGLCHEHVGSGERPGLNHLDLYRVADTDELWELGFEDYLSSDRITAIEWAQRFANQLPASYLRVELEVSGESERLIRLTVQGASPELESALRELGTIA